MVSSFFAYHEDDGDQFGVSGDEEGEFGLVCLANDLSLLGLTPRFSPGSTLTENTRLSLRLDMKTIISW